MNAELPELDDETAKATAALNADVPAADTHDRTIDFEVRMRSALETIDKQAQTKGIHYETHLLEILEAHVAKLPKPCRWCGRTDPHSHGDGT